MNLALAYFSVVETLSFKRGKSIFFQISALDFNFTFVVHLSYST